MTLGVSITTQCNLKCRMCHYHQGGHPAPEVMEWSVMEQVVERAVRDGANVSIGQVGEPLMHPFCSAFVSKLRRHGVPVHVCSNGTLGCFQADSWQISLNATNKQTYREITGSPLFRVARQTAMDILDAGMPLTVSAIRGVLPDESIDLFIGTWIGRGAGVKIYPRAPQLTMTGDRPTSCKHVGNSVYVLPDGTTGPCCRTVAFGIPLSEPFDIRDYAPCSGCPISQTTANMEIYK